MEYSYKFRLYPNDTQKILIERTFGCCRFVYNHFLAQRIEQYKTVGKAPTRFMQDKDLTVLKHSEGTEWLCEVDKCALQNSLRNLDTAYQNFFRRVKCGEKPGFPVFKSKKNNHNSYTTNSNLKVFESAVQLPKLGKVKCAISKQVQGRILNATVSRNPSGKYFVSLCCTEVDIPALPKTGAVIGISLGVKDLATTSDGTKYPSNRHIQKAEKKLRRLQRSLSRKTKGSKNREKARIKVACLQEKIANQRKDDLHKLTTELVRGCDVICIQDLDVKGMMQDHRFAKLLADASFGEFRRQLEYKTNWYGKTVSVVDRFYPSSQLCSCCGNRNPEVKSLSRQSWTCPSCGTTHDRVVNAATNILNEGLRLLA